MIKLLFKRLKKKYPDEAREFVAEQEMLALFLNSPDKQKLLNALRLAPAKKKQVKQVIDAYAKCKVNAEKKLKKKSREKVIKIENKCLSKLFEGHILKIKTKGTKKQALKIAKNLIIRSFPDAAVLDENKMALLARKVRLKKKFPTDFLVFEGKKKKIVSYGVVTK